MPYKANEARRHKIPRARYKVRNWPEYDRALQQRGSLTVWATPEALAAWHPPRRMLLRACRRSAKAWASSSPTAPAARPCQIERER